MTTKTQSNHVFFLVVILLTCVQPQLFSQTIIPVTECSLNGWVKNPPSSPDISFVSGPSAPPQGKGSIQFNAPVPAFIRVRNTRQSGVLLSSLTELKYSTYVQQAKTNLEAPFVVLQVDNDMNGTVDASIVFNPRWQTGSFITGPQLPDQGVIQKDTWQTWDALNGGWWTGPAPNPDDGGVMYKLSTYISRYPNARIMNDAEGGIRLNGSAATIFSNNFIGNADAFIIGINGITTVYDFELGVDAGLDRTVFHGYKNCTTLSGTTSGGNEPLQYKWSAVVQTIGNALNVTVCPLNTTTYTLTVTDANKCIRNDNVTVFVTDVRCGSKMDKAMVCHKRKLICISSNAVEAHLNHGDELGDCSSSISATSIDVRSVAPQAIEEQSSSEGIKLFPNPAQKILVVQLRATDKNLLVFDATGRVIKLIRLAQTGLTTTSIDISNLQKGMYFVKYGKDIVKFIKQ